MSGATIPYHLRPHKAVDRRLFIDLLSRIERWHPLDESTYISMGAYPLEDHKLVHRVIGTSRLIAFDMDAEIVARQQFNKPIAKCHCIKMKSGDLIENLDQVLADCPFDTNGRLVIWLDYTDPKSIGNQVREFEALLNKLRAGDVVRVTVNAHPPTLGDFKSGDGKPPLKDQLHTKRFEELKKRVKDYLPSFSNADHMTDAGLLSVYAGAFAVAALNAFPTTNANMFQPLSIVRYADGQQMLSITGMVVERTRADEFIKKLAIAEWPFSSLAWDAIHKLVVPDLTVRERLFLERGVLASTPDQLVTELGFTKASGISVSDFIDSYKKYYRFYPSLLTAEL